MAEKRMLSKRIIESDLFLDLSAKAQMLYLHLVMAADDDGFVNNPRKLQRMCGVEADVSQDLTTSNFLISFESGIVVITHWWVHNLIQKDRYKPSDCINEKKRLRLKENREYTLNQNEMVAPCLQTGNTVFSSQLRPVDLLESVCLQNGNTEEHSSDKINSEQVSADEPMYQLGNEKISHTQYNVLIKDFPSEVVDAVIERIVSHPYLNRLNEKTIRQWCTEAIQKPKPKNTGKNKFQNFDQREYNYEELERSLIIQDMDKN